MINAIIIDDEPHAAERVSDLLKRYCTGTINLMGMFHSVDDGVKAINFIQPQLIFLDVHIRDKTGFDLLKQLPDKKFDVIFVTAYEKYAIDAFKFSAIDYLLKPVEADDFIKAVEKLTRNKTVDELSNKFQILLENVEQLKQYTPPKKIVVPTISGFELLPVIDIIRCESDVNYTTIYTKDRAKLVVAKTLREFEDMLSDYNFFRIHNSHLVNLAYVKSYQKGKGGSVIMYDNSTLEVSTRRKDEFIEKMKSM